MSNICIKCGKDKESKKRCLYCAKIYQAKYRKEHYEVLNERAKTWYDDNKEEVKQKNSINRRALTLYHNNYEYIRKNNDPTFKLRKNCSRLINLALKGNKSNLSIMNYLPYTMSELKNHIEKQFDEKMSWENYGSYWHIDHIYPQSKLQYTSMEDDNFKKCWALSNLQPLEKIMNIKKSNKIGGHNVN